MSKSSKILIWCIVAVVLVLILSIVLTSTLNAPKSVDFTEFVQMIATQRGFQANSKGVTTTDTMLETVINMKR